MTTDRLGNPLSVGDRVKLFDTWMAGMEGVILAISGDMLDIQMDDQPSWRIHIDSAHVDKM